jgi:hypothetical protein
VKCKLIRSNALNSPSIESLAEIIQKIDHLSASKRKEEQLKFIFHWVYKTLKARFASRDKRSLSTANLEDSFYTYYFGDVCQANNATLQQFRRPCVRRRLGGEWPKSFNASFLRLIKQSGTFMSDLRQALDIDLELHQERKIDWKVRKFFERWESQLEVSGNQSQVFKELTDSMNNCKKFKFPWSIRETVDAREVVKRILLSPNGKA